MGRTLCAPTDNDGRIYGAPPKPSGDSRGFGGESRSSGMSELSPQAEARDVELATTKGRPHVAARGPVRPIPPIRGKLSSEARQKE